MEIARRQHVAIVEDDRGFGLSLAALFESDGVATDFFPSAESFFDRLDWAIYRCVVVDMMLPGMNGMALCEHLSRDRYPPRMILMSGTAFASRLDARLDQAAVRRVEKPFDPWLMCRDVHDMLGEDGPARTSDGDAPA
ncbi:response regulator [uncultured Salinisphaera sp.]|uniref:response regulator n=1 Tax=uncultured Salinisphaera sp. TaxID=359372 RepID=UPI0032B2A9A2|tara:strand:- start:6803 stop:7216 length:414 start_codon:yes stop_codon:yes gene_type:complete